MADEAERVEEQRASFRQRVAAFLVGEDAEVVPSEQYGLMEAEVADARVLRKDLDLLAWTALDYMGGSEQDMKAVERRKLVQRSRIAWSVDPQVGASTELMNDFALGRGVPKPKARDDKVQQVLDEAWDDEDNQLVLTSFAAQLQMGTDLTLQANLFFLVFDSGDDGKVKLAMLDHDTVENVVRDPDNRRRILWYVARTKRIKWNFESDSAEAMSERDRAGVEKVLYYQHWNNEVEGDAKPPAAKIGKGKVYHVAINRTGEMAFGHPTMHRMLRWATAFNNLMEARVDMAKAAAAFIMKRKVKGTPNQVRKLAQQMLSKRAQLGVSSAPDEPETGELSGPRSGSVLTENEGVEHETFSLDSNASNANLDAQMLRSQISSGSPGRWPQHYLGDIGSSNLATASAMELVPMKAVEARQEVIEQVFRWFCDLVIERAVDSGRLPEMLTDEEIAQRQEEEEEGKAQPQPTTLPEPEGAPAGSGETEEAATDLGEPTPEDNAELEDEEDENKRDLSYDFSLPSPIRKMLADLVTAVQTIASTFDPNNTNIDLSRTLLAIVLGEGLEMADPGEVVDKVFPPGYQDPAMAALGALKDRQPPPPPGEQPSGGEREPTDQEGNPYMVRQNGNGNPYGELAEALAEAMLLRRRDGGTLEEALIERLGPEARKRLEERMAKGGEDFDRATEQLRELAQGDG